MTDLDFRPTHVVPLDGMQTWAAPDVAQPSVWLDALLPVRLLSRQGDWARVACSNGWAAWVDGRLLLSVPDGPPGTANALADAPDPAALLARIEEAVGEYRQLVEQLADGRIDLEAFRARTVGLRLGLVVDGESAWLLELEQDRWWYCDGTRLQTFATVEAPPQQHAATTAGPPPPTRMGER